MTIGKLITTAVVCLLLVPACATFSQKKPMVSFSENTKLTYQGNSAAMMSMIGTMGIAIGVAIDEGIGKEIEAGLTPKGGSKSILKECLVRQFQQHPSSDVTKIAIEQIVIIPKDEGYYAALSGNLVRGDQQSPFNVGKRELGLSADLTELKTNPDLVFKLLESVCNGLVQTF